VIRRRSSGSDGVAEIAARRQRRVASSPASRGVTVSPRAVVQAQQPPPPCVSRPPALLESACGRGPQKGRTHSFAVPSCCRPVAKERSRTEASSFFLDPSRQEAQDCRPATYTCRHVYLVFAYLGWGPT
jgi:hypothetical protein